MASMPKFSYRRLINEEETSIRFKSARKWSRIAIRKRPKLRIPGLTRFLRRRSRFFLRLKLSWRKAFKRLKDGQPHMNDLFGGNFLVLQHNHSPFKTGKNPF
ncbi:Non-LTR retrolelement reverse transcriptase-like protein [Hibiscus syriacus]|uniref:Non-LTR retrolelement reverse transcriptase-like protein n=1 Tax=Hibiscus syriacus TaxID=106335 RepID=A0A6A2XAV8_HIBSY|nr:Non-LTR retrolelement reverse transcriptase-like protein [Hibiscus syriacus]